SATKWAVEGFSEALAGEVAPFGIGVLIVEPGPFRTDFASRSLVLPRTRLEAYQPVHEMLAAFVATSGTQVGDPVRAAALIVDTCLQDSPPLRLVLGGKTFHSAIQTLERRLADVRRSADLAGAADYPESAT
ncbi:MAG: SDR family NAD(P)-dependent oxidoreductase, partial [Pseudomonadota bacterium]